MIEVEPEENVKNSKCHSVLRKLCHLIPLVRIIQLMTFKIKCFYLKFKKKINFMNALVVLLVFGLFLLMCFLWMFFGVPESTEVHGWEKSKSRNAKEYVFPDKLTTIITPNHGCNSENSPLMLITVCSKIEHVELRTAIRETWGSIARRNTLMVVFLMGTNSEKEISPDILNENDQYGDIIIEDFTDTYNNLTIKTIMMLKWMNQNCLNAKFLMKIDDDVYVNVNNLLKMVISVKDHDLPGFLLGKLYTTQRPSRISTSKWFMPKSMFADDIYPHYLSGVGYVMSSQVAQILYRESLKNDLIYIEDLFITGICAEKANLKQADHLGFYFFEHPVTVECTSIQFHLILLSHYLTASLMRDQHEQILKCWREMLLPKWIRGY